ncbi:MAG: 2-hydroxyacyl-CoA dehydratase [Phycisphaerae bacterium]
MVIYTCPYVPEEWIVSHGLQPSRIMPNPAGSVRSIAPIEGVCPYVRAFINEVITNKQACGVVVTTVCDQMRRAFDIIKRRCDTPAFLMNVPNTWQSVAAQKLYLDELKRLGQFLIQLGGETPSKEELVKVMLEYDTARVSIRAARGYLSSRQYSEAIAEFNRQGKCSIADDVTDSELSANGIPLAIVGGPLLKDDFQIFDIIENFGGRIVLDATETGERGMCAPFDHRKLRGDPLIELANAYFNGIQDVSRRPNSQLYEWFKREFDSRAVRGIIFRRYLWCDMWHAELRRLKDWINLPVLDIDTAGDSEVYRHREVNRIRTFLETLQ